MSLKVIINKHDTK